MEERTTISTYENGPFLVTGGVFRVVDAEGGEFPVEKETIALCLRSLDEEAVLRRDAL